MGFAVTGWTAFAPPASAQSVHELKANPSNVHIGHFNAALKPALKIGRAHV